MASSDMPLYVKAALLFELGFRPAEIARSIYRDLHEKDPKKATNRVIALLHYSMNSVQRLYDCENSMTNEPMITAFSRSFLHHEVTVVEGTLGVVMRKINSSREDRYLEELSQFLRLIYQESGLAERDFDRAVLVFADNLLRSKAKGLLDLEEEKPHVKRSYVKITPRAAALVYACLFVATYNLPAARDLHREILRRIEHYLGLRVKKPRELLVKELETILPAFAKYLV